MKALLIILTLALFSCKAEHQLQMQTGTYSSYNGHIKFTPVSTWRNFPSDTTFKGFRVRNTTKKYLP